MKKVVAVFIGIYFVAMGTMLVWGFIDKQQKEERLREQEETSETSEQKTLNPTSDTSSTAAQGVPPSTTTSPAPTTKNTSSSTTAPTNTPTQTNTGTGTTNPLSRTEVAKHNKASDCWLIINNNVYNVTNYIDLHPGGADLILMDCGKDATQDYNTQGGRGKKHSANANKQLANYLIGTIAL
jgi:cytochrome b involved in lipid metabolism